MSENLPTRRAFTLAAVAAGASTNFPGPVWAGSRPWRNGTKYALRLIEERSGGRLGVAALDTGTGALAFHRGTERFPLCSTFKLLAAGAILRLVDKGLASLDDRIRFTKDEVVANSPVTETLAGGSGVPLSLLCEAAITRSDNTAGNMLLRRLGGPTMLTRFARSIGDHETRLDRTEPTLNEAAPGDPRDTTTPRFMMADIRALALGNVLSAGSSGQLIAWLKANKTGDRRMRADLPAGWIVGDKTGSGERGTTNDVGMVWPPSASPIIACIFLTGTAAGPQERDRTIAAVATSLFSVTGS